MLFARASVRAALVLAPLGLAICQAGPARAGGLQFDPVYLHLSAGAPTTSLRLTNRGDRPMRYQVAPYSWAQSPTGEMQLGPTEELMVFPMIVSLAPGEERVLRVGTTAAFGATEKTFRVVIDEFPSEADAKGPALIRIRSRVILPVFLDPPKPEGTASVAAAAVHGPSLDVELRSTGNAHALFTGVRAVALADGDKPLYEHRWGPSYLLTGGKLRLTASAPKELCKKVRAVRVEAQPAVTGDVHAPPVERTVPLACVP